MGHLNSFSASGGGNLNKNFPKIQMHARGVALRFLQLFRAVRTGMSKNYIYLKVVSCVSKGNHIAATYTLNCSYLWPDNPDCSTLTCL